MILYRLKSKLDGKYYQCERKFRLQHTTSKIWRTKRALYHFFINLTVSNLQFLNLIYVVERQNTRLNRLFTVEIAKFFNFF